MTELQSEPIDAADPSEPRRPGMSFPVLNGAAQCTATSHKTGERCGAAATLPLGVCDRHGAKTPASQAIRQRWLAEARATRRLDEIGVTPIGDPLKAFADLAAEAVALKDVFAGWVAELTDVRYEGRQGSEQLRSEVALYERAMDRAGKFLTDWVRLGFDERQVRVSEAQTVILMAVIEATLADPELNLTPDQRAAGPAIVARHVQAIAIDEGRRS